MLNDDTASSRKPVLDIDACRWCVQSVSTAAWKKVHPCLSNKWLDRDFRFWKAGTVRCYFNDYKEGTMKVTPADRRVDGDPPFYCPYRWYHITLSMGSKPMDPLLPLGATPPDPRDASFVQAMTESIVENPTVDFQGKQLGKYQEAGDDSLVTNNGKKRLQRHDRDSHQRQ